MQLRHLPCYAILLLSCSLSLHCEHLILLNYYVLQTQ